MVLICINAPEGWHANAVADYLEQSGGPQGGGRDQGGTG